MNNNYCIFDRLPVELLHNLFNYFSASELFYTFYNIDDYVNATLESYSSYQLDLKSISKSHFRCICRHVQPEQVISLILSDDNDTPGLTQLFFSRFRIEQFLRLRSLTLINIEFNSSESIFSNLYQLQELRSLSFDPSSIRHIYRELDLNLKNKIEQINLMLCNTYTQLFPRLQFLSINNNSLVESIPLSNLLYLKLPKCSIEKLELITKLAPKLKVLDISVNLAWISLHPISLPSQLIRLNLKISNFPVRMNYIEMLLSDNSSVRHLQLDIKGFKELADGQRWQNLTKSLITFDFIFDINVELIHETLDSFRTSFWIEEKQWFVAYQNPYLFSVPYFAPKTITSSYSIPVYSTVPSDSIFYNNVDKLIVNETQIPTEHVYRIKTLELACPILQADFAHTIDFRHIKSLSISSLNDILQFISIASQMPNLCQLSIENEITKDHIETIKHNSYKQIHTLEIDQISNANQYDIIEQLFQLFPKTKTFMYKSDIQSIALMTHFIDGFKDLTNASFISLGPLYNKAKHFCYHPDLIILKTKRPLYGLSICRISYSTNNTSSFNIDWWIEE